MSSTRLTIAALAVALAGALAGSAQASPPAPVTLSVSTTFAPNAVDPFTSTGGVVCAAGTVSTLGELFAGFQSGFHVQILVVKHFVCANGTFDLRLRVTFDFGTAIASGSWSVCHGTGTYAGLHGSGKITGTEIPGGIQDEYTGKMSIDP